MATIGRTAEPKRFLESLLAQTDRNFEVLVVDQNPDNRLVPILQAMTLRGLPLRHLRLDFPSLSNARNLGIAQAAGDLVGFPDDDCWYEEGTIAAVRQCFEVNKDADGVVGCWVEQSLARGEEPSSGNLSICDWRDFRGGDASSISLFFKTKLLAKVGGFDGRLGVGHWYGAAEEIDLLLRALDTGATLIHCQSARVHHMFSTEPEPLSWYSCNATRRRARGTGAIYAKHKLATWTMVRGLAAPILKPLFRISPKGIVRGGFVSLGRFEGFLRWKSQQR